MTNYVYSAAQGLSWGITTLVNETTLSLEHSRTTVKEASKGVLHLALAILSGASDLMTLSSSPVIRNASMQLEMAFAESCSDTYYAFLRVINPHAQLNDRYGDEFPVSQGRFEAGDTPNVLQRFSRYQQESLNWLYTSRFMLIRATTHVVAPLTALAALVAGAVVLTFGLVAAALSIATLGLNSRLNTFAYDTLETSGWMVNQFHQGVLGIFRPDLVCPRPNPAPATPPRGPHVPHPKTSTPVRLYGHH